MTRNKKDRDPLFKNVISFKQCPSVDPSTGQQTFVKKTEELVPRLPEELAEFAEYMNNRLAQTEAKLDKSTEQSRRLANSLESVIPKFVDQSVNHTSQDIVFGHLKEGVQADVAIADSINVASEALYALSTGELADMVGNKTMTANRMGMILRELHIFGDSKYHHTYKTTRKGQVQKYKRCTVDEIYRRLASPSEFGITANTIQKIGNFIKPKGV